MTNSPTLVCVAEDQFLHGHVLSTWMTDYIDLEESLAVGSIVQENLAHATLLLELAGFDDHDRDRFIYERGVTEWHPMAVLRQQERAWPFAVVRGLIVATAGAAWSGLLADGGTGSTARAARTMLAEQSLHVKHWSQWLCLLMADPGTREETARCASAALVGAADAFGAGPGMPHEMVLDHLHRSWTERIRSLLDEAGIESAPRSRGPAARQPGRTGTQLEAILADVSRLRLASDDGVRGLYR